MRDVSYADASSIPEERTMNRFNSVMQWVGRVVSVTMVALILSACADDGSTGVAGEPGQGVATLSSSTELNFNITGVTITSGKPVVSFSVTNQDGVPVAGFGETDLRFNIAKLIPGATSNWQNYINLTSTDRPIYGSQERSRTGYPWGTLVDNKNGTFKYTFATDISNTSVTCPSAPCLDADGNTLDLSYQPSLVHRVTIQQGNSAYPRPNVAYDFIPSGGTITDAHEITTTATCNECHNQLAIHGSRTEIKLCVTCHNPGTWSNENPGVTPNQTVDFKVLVHKIHMGEDLPSVVASTPYIVGGHDYSTVVFPQDTKNCAKCHDGTVTAQGDNWKTQLSKVACSACHDDVYFGTTADPLKTYETISHLTLSGATDPADSACITCHVSGGVAGSVEEKHAVPVNVAATKFQYNILEICGTAVGSNPDCAGVAPTVKFSVSDPTGATTHGYGNLYDVADVAIGPAPGQDPEYSTAGAGLNILTAWDSSDYNNNLGAGSRPARANSTSAISGATDNLDGTFTITLAALPVASGSAAVAMEGHPRGESVVGSGTYDLNVPVRGAVAYFTVNGGTLVERRVAVDITAKCDNCHNNLSLHGANRADNAQLCVMCHNPRNTDIGRRDNLPAGVTDGIPEVGLDGKLEETIDMKVLIHAIHAGDLSEHGIREDGIVVYGYGGSAHDYSHVRFPGILSDCTTCHNTGTYELDGKWATPLQSGIQATTMKSAPTASTAVEFTTQIGNQSDDLLTTPTAAVCSACHDGALAKAHMSSIGGAVFEGNAAAMTNSYETCSICHGPGKTADVNVVHGIE